MYYEMPRSMKSVKFLNDFLFTNFSFTLEYHCGTERVKMTILNKNVLYIFLKLHTYIF